MNASQEPTWGEITMGKDRMMKQRITGVCAALVFVGMLGLGVLPARAEIKMRTESFGNNNAGFAQMEARIEDENDRNLLSRPGVRIFGDPSNPQLTDGTAGVREGDGRVAINGQPSVIAFYLGQPKPIHEIGVFTYNPDTRSNQDFEVRVANNIAHPGQKPCFPDQPLATTGSKILGNNGGGFHTSFVAADGGALTAEKADWVEFRIWRAYGLHAGETAKTNKATDWTSVVELQVFGDAKDVIALSPKAKALAAELRQRGNHAPYEKKATWWETMLASREALLRWECETDQLTLERGGVSLGDWRALPPFPADAKEIGLIERMKQIDPAQSVAVNGKQLAWQSCDAIKDGRVVDLAGALKAQAGQVVILARSLDCGPASHFNASLGLKSAKLWVAGGRSSFNCGEEGTVNPNDRMWGLQENAGHHVLLAMLTVGKDGRCDFWFAPQPLVSRHGGRDERTNQRLRLYDRVRGDFRDAVSLQQIKWEQADNIWVRMEKRAMSGREYFPTDWDPANPRVLIEQYSNATQDRLAAVEKELLTIEKQIASRVAPWVQKFKAESAPVTLADARRRYNGVTTIQAAMAEHHKIESMRLAVQDQSAMFADKYPKAAEYLARIDALDQQMAAVWPKAIAGADDALAAIMTSRERIAAEGKEILLSNPLLAFDKLLLGKGGPGFASNWGGPNFIGNELVTLSPVKPDGQITSIYRGGHISDMDLSFDAKKILFSENVRIHEINADGSGHRQITTHTDQHTKHYDCCRLPDGKIMFVSTACEQAVPCTGEWYVGNMHLIDDDGTHERRLCFDQDHDWNPCVLNTGQVIYTRWEYTDTPHYFTRLLFTMNPDGSNQAEFMHSNSYWPNATYWPRPIPGYTSRIVGIVSGHHGVGRVGQMVVFDAAQGRQEADGVVNRIGDRGKKVEPVIEDALVSYVWPRFAWPYPLSEPGTNRGAGKYFLVNCQPDEWSPWGVYLVDTFDNMTPLLIGSYAEPIPLRPRPTPPTVPSKVDPSRKDAVVYMVNAYKGGGLNGYPAGTVKALRIGTHQYRYGGNGDTYACTYEGGWDVKRIIGTVPVEADGSALFRVPANTPIFVQPLDADGKALQVMRSWFSAMPGETLSCVGCHERQSDAPPGAHTLASQRAPSDIQPWYGPARGFSFEREVQPVLDRRCAGCHDGKPRSDGKRVVDLSAKSLHPEFHGPYSPSYMALAPYVRRAGYEADYHMAVPSEWHASTSPLVQLLDKGHYNVRLTREEQERLYTWIDFNVPYAGYWRESRQPPQDDQVIRRAKYKALFANVDDHSEDPMPLPAVAAYEPPAPMAPAAAPMSVAGFPFSAEQAAQMQKRLGGPIQLDLGNGVSMSLSPIPAGKFVMGDVNGTADELPQAAVTIASPFYMGCVEVTNRQYAQFDSRHDSAYIEGRGKDRFTRGYPVNEPDQPVVRVSWHQAMEFCRWLSEKTHQKCALPTEAQWEWACRAGSASAWSFGDTFSGRNGPVANVADATLNGWAWGRVEPGYSDGAMFTVPGGKYPANAWGLFDMHGNAAEWTCSDYRPYPYVESDGRNKLDPATRKVVRGGSWNDTFRYCRSASRWGYVPAQPVYNVGFRVIVELACQPVSKK